MTDAPHRHGLPPLLGANPALLILGSYPSLSSLQREEYYAHPRNQFWTLTGRLFGFDPASTYRERCQALAEQRIAVWDVCAFARREGSLDAAIEVDSVIPNDLGRLLREQPTIRRVFVNGKTAASLLDRLKSDSLLLKGRKILPSSSPAHAAMPLEKKLEQWSALLPDRAG